MACFLLKHSGMRGQVRRTTVVTLILLALLYYGVAWAVLRCPHQESQPDQEAALYNASSYVVFDGGRAESDCTGPRYHTESLAGPSGSTESLRLIRDFASHFHAFPAFLVDKGQFADAWLGHLLNNLSTTAIHLPRYLSFSVFRF